MSEFNKENLNQKIILTLLANPEFIKVCDRRAIESRKKLPFVISEKLDELAEFMGLDSDT